MDYTSTVLLQSAPFAILKPALEDVLAQTEKLIRERLEGKIPELGNALRQTI